MNVIARIGSSLRRLNARFSSTPSWQAYLGASLPLDYRRAVGDGTGSSTVMASLLWILRTFPEAPPMVSEVLDDDQLKPARRHPMTRLLRRPNAHYSGAVLWMATLASYYVDGNSYWLKARDRQERVTELWWVPHWLLEPRWSSDGSDFISWYEYRVGGETIRIPASEVVHFRFGLDPANHRKGLSPLASVVREIYTDQEAARFTAALLRNMGVPGLLVSPEHGDYTPESDEVEETKAYLKSMFTGDRRGEPLVMTGPTKVTSFGFSPEQLNLKDLRRIPEERVSAVLGVPAVVAGLGAGLDRSTFTNMAEAREMAYESNIIPTQRLMAEDLHWQLLTDFEEEPEAWEVGFDLSKVRVLQEDEQRKAGRWTLMVGGGLAMVSEGRRACDLPVPDDGSQDVFLRPVNLIEVPSDPAQREAPPQGAADPQIQKLIARVRASAAELEGALAGPSHGNGNGDH